MTLIVPGMVRTRLVGQRIVSGVKWPGVRTVNVGSGWALHVGIRMATSELRISAVRRPIGSLGNCTTDLFQSACSCVTDATIRAASIRGTYFSEPRRTTPPTVMQRTGMLVENGITPGGSLGDLREETGAARGFIQID